MKKQFFIWCTCLLVAAVNVGNLKAQQLPFADEINSFISKDSTAHPPKNAILMVGSSSFRKWTDVQAAFPTYPIINRGFGGSTLPEVIMYANQIIFPYQPKQILIYAGDNDLASSDAVTPAMVADRFKTLFNLIRANLPAVNIGFVAIKPSPSREKLLPKMIESNQLIKDFISTQQNASFIDVFNPMLINSKADPSLFIEDNLHMNAKGYRIWQNIIQPYLLK